jgi:hypothetical protein
MKKLIIVMSMLFLTLPFLSKNVSAIGSCDIGPEFCFEDPGDGGTGVYPDNYLVDTGLLATIVKSDGYLVDTYNIYVRANEVSIDLNTSDLFFKKYASLTTYYTDDLVYQRDPYAGLTSGGAYWLNPGIDKTEFEQTSQFSGVSLTGFTVLVEANNGGDLYTNYGLSNQSIRHMPNAYYNETSDAFMLSQYNGLDGSFGRYVYAKAISSTSYSNYKVLGWGLLGILDTYTVLAYTSYTSYYALPINSDKADLIYLIVINR